MKTLLLLIGCVLFQLTSSAQAYHPLIEDDKVWLEAFYIGSNECAFEEVYQLRFGGDTLIAGNSYRKILKRSFDPVSPGPYCPPFEAQDAETMVPDVFMREDTTAHQVFIWHIDENNYPDGQELLLYDFTLEVGDTLPMSVYSTEGSTIPVTGVSEITLMNGETRKRIEYIGLDYGAIIEGIGSEHGLFRPIFAVLFWDNLCVKQGGSSIYPSFGSFLQCNWMTAIDEIQASDINLFPNPNDGSFRFDYSAQNVSSTLQLVIFNTMGQRVFADRVVNGVNAIEVSVPGGAYYWQLRSLMEPFQSGKMVVR